MKRFPIAVVLVAMAVGSSARAEDEEQARHRARQEAKAAAAEQHAARASQPRNFSGPVQRSLNANPNRGMYQPTVRTPEQQLRHDARYQERTNPALQTHNIARQNPGALQNGAINRDGQSGTRTFNGRNATLTPEERAARRAARQNDLQPVNRNSFVEASARHRHERHDRDWWRSHYTRIVIIGGGCYAWDAGYWYPAYGYDNSYNYYSYDGPICGAGDLPPDQVIANVQSALQQDGYYEGEVDGDFGPLTQIAVARYQRDHGLLVTSAIDEPTLASLGLL